MKSLLIAVGLAIALSVSAQTTTTTDEQQQQPTHKAKTKTEENVQPAQTKQNVSRLSVSERGRTLNKTPTDRKARESTANRDFAVRSDIPVHVSRKRGACHTARPYSAADAKRRSTSRC